jgi:anthranilate phosphoribosyltransferase
MSASRNLKVNDAAESKLRLLEALDNRAGIARDIVAFNAGAALYAAGLAGTIADAIKLAKHAIGTGEARAKLEAFVAATRKLVET